MDADQRLSAFIIITKPARRIFFAHSVFTPATDPRSTNSTIRLSMQSIPSSPSRPCPPLGTTTLRLFDKVFAMRSAFDGGVTGSHWRSEEHTSELQSQFHLVCRLLLEKKKIIKTATLTTLA